MAMVNKLNYSPNEKVTVISQTVSTSYKNHQRRNEAAKIRTLKTKVATPWHPRSRSEPHKVHNKQLQLAELTELLLAEMCGLRTRPPATQIRRILCGSGLTRILFYDECFP